MGALLAVAGEQEQAPVDRETERKAGDEVERVDRERGKRRELSQQEEADEHGDPARERRQQARDEAAEEEEGEQDDQRHRDELGAAKVALDRRRELVIRDRIAAERHPRIAGEGCEETLAGVLLLLVIERSQGGDHVGRAAVGGDHRRIARRRRIENRDHRRVAAQFHLDLAEQPARGRRTVGARQPNKGEHTVAGVDAGALGYELACLHAARAGDVEPAWLEMVVDMDAERRRDGRDRQRNGQNSPGATVDQIGENGQHQPQPTAMVQARPWPSARHSPDERKPGQLPLGS